ncbi:MAG: type I-MYXAN CRISPR-associated Cas8a1/Cmx1 [Crocosphaera sp.]|nr:type I-MYXAN CRISPR-associated Cas8a1/Cmx1 [Crocosphaera sp.]
MKLANKPRISLSLSASDTTIMHRAGMTGLYMSLKKLEQQFRDPQSRAGNLSWSLTSDTIELFWQGSDFTALDWLLKQSFQLSSEGFIQFKALENKAVDLRRKIHLHEGICAIFLRHNKFSQKGKPIKVSLTVQGETTESEYKPLTWYVHQTFAAKLCEEKTKQLQQDYTQITSWLYLGGIVRHARTQNKTKLEEKPEYALALLFVPIVCQYYLLHLASEDIKEKNTDRYLVVIPEINNFEEASQRRWQLQQLEPKQLHVSSIGEAALLYYSLDKMESDKDYYQACQVWLYEKMNKQSHQRMLANIEEIKIAPDSLHKYQLIQQYFQPNDEQIQAKKILIKVNLLRSLIADNLAKELPWWSDLWEKLIIEDSKSYLFKQLLLNKTGLIGMIEDSEIKEKYLSFIKVFQHAMTVYFAKIYNKTKAGKEAPVNKKVERLRAELNCCYDELSFLQYLSDFLARGGLNESFYENQEQVLLLIEEVPWEKLRIWSLLAIASYQPKEKKTNTDKNLLTTIQEAGEVNSNHELSE